MGKGAQMTSIRAFSTRFLFVLAAVFFTAVGRGEAAGQEGRFPFVFDIVPVIWGCDVGIGYRGWSALSGLDTILWVYAGGGYEQMTYQRLPDGTLITGKAPAWVAPGTDPFYNRWSGRWQLGIAQGISWNPRIEANLLETFLFYRGRLDSNQQSGGSQLLFLSTIPDRNGIFQNALLAGLKLNDLSLDPRTKMKKGVLAELSLEWGPAFFLNSFLGTSDYARANLTGRLFLPLFDVDPSGQMNLFAVSLSEFFAADYAFGANVPLNIRQTFGGLDPRVGLGLAMRGVDMGSMDTNLKLVNNLELRATLPALWMRDLVPGVVAYFDAGYFNQIGEGFPSPASGFLCSTGAGAFIDVFDITSLTGYVNYRLTGVNGDGSRLTFSFEFDVKF
jgi:hypothetical protein